MNKYPINKEKFEKIILLIEKYINYPVIVEGNKDKISLSALGFRRVFVLNKGKKSIAENIEQIEKEFENKEISILTDFDKKGRFLYSELKKELCQKNVKINENLRNLIQSLGISHIEGLKNFLKNL